MCLHQIGWHCDRVVEISQRRCRVFGTCIQDALRCRSPCEFLVELLQRPGVVVDLAVAGEVDYRPATGLSQRPLQPTNAFPDVAREHEDVRSHLRQLEVSLFKVEIGKHMQPHGSPLLTGRP